MRPRAWTGAAALLVLGVVSLLFFQFYLFYFTPYQKQQDLGIVDVPFGATVQETAEILSQQGWIPWVPGFVVLVRLTESSGPIRAGEYRLTADMSPWEVLDHLRNGSVVLHKVTVPEGLRGTDVAGIVMEKLSLSRARFMELFTDSELIHSLGLSTTSLEGYLLPETYAFPKNVTEEQVIRKMVQELLNFFDEEKRRRAQDLGMTLHQILTLASIIEKEVGVESESPRISSVYHNRMRKKMLLQSDPTVIYGIEDFDGNLRWKDLKEDTPYNTYLRPGLPPTPIANPGKASILAALSPEETDYLYFVSRNDRTHIFSRNLADHNRAVDRYQKRR